MMMTTKLTRLARDERGATMVEYGIMAVLIAAVCISVIVALGIKVNGLFESANTAL
jgi:pilus assembly protein Flp/PilA